jgi:hypothetical protein
MVMDQYYRVLVLAKRMKWFIDNRYDITRANITDDLRLIEDEVEKIERAGILDSVALDRLESIIRTMEEEHKPEDAWLWD